MLIKYYNKVFTLAIGPLIIQPVIFPPEPKEKFEVSQFTDLMGAIIVQDAKNYQYITYQTWTTSNG